MLGGGLGMRRAETAPAELPLEAVAKDPAAAVHALDLAAPTRTGAGAGECKAGHAGKPLAAVNGLARARALDGQGAGGAGSSAVGGPNGGRAAGIGAADRNSDDTVEGATVPGLGKALAGSDAGGRLHGKAPAVADRRRPGREGGGNRTLSGPGPPGSESATH